MIRVPLEIMKDFSATRLESFGVRFGTKHSDAEALHAVMMWLLQAAEKGKGGVSGHFNLLTSRWTSPFPETTGYIIPTMLQYAKEHDRPVFAKHALVNAVWLVGVQNPDGGCRQGLLREGKAQPSIVFNTGQNIFGFLAAFHHSGEDRFLKAALHAGDFLVNSADSHGIWTKHLVRGMQLTINTRCSHALLELDSIEGSRGFREIGAANLDWAVEQQEENGWFRNCASRRNGYPSAHFLSYTMEGLLGGYAWLRHERYLEAAVRTATRMMKLYEIRRKLPCYWSQDWEPKGRYMKNRGGNFQCLTGYAQIASVWFELFAITNEWRFLNAGLKILDDVKQKQTVRSVLPGVRGGIKGSFPVYGGYASMRYPNWAAKFFADALMRKNSIMLEIDFARREHRSEGGRFA